MLAGREPVTSLRDEELIDLFSRRLPDLLERRPELEPALFHAFLKTFARREEVALVVTELRALRTEMESRFEQVDQRIDQFRAAVADRFDQVDTRFEQVDQRIDQFRAAVADRFDQVDQRFDQVDQRFDQVDQRFDQVDQRFDQVDQRFDQVVRSIDRLGSRWGIRNESLFRRTMAALLEQSFGVGVEQRTIAGEQFDIVIHDHQHVLVEIAASVGPTIQARLERKRRLYEESTGVRPARVILATASIHSDRAHRLRQAGIEVIEPEEPDDPPENG